MMKKKQAFWLQIKKNEAFTKNMFLTQKKKKGEGNLYFQ